MHVTLDGVDFELKQPHDFSWIRPLGRVFRVYDRQDSGNLLFGVEQGGVKRFVKYAGASTVAYEGAPGQAVERLRQALCVYRAVAHPHLIRFEGAVTCPQGLAAVFEWFEGRGLHEHWTFRQLDKLDPASPYGRYLRLPLERRFKSLTAVFECLCHVEALGYVAVDFYDGSILYDFERDVTKVGDIDFYRRRPAVNDLGEAYWGSPRFKPPEEYRLGAAIGPDTNVFTLGALILHLFGRYSQDEVEAMYRQRRFTPCPLERWSLNEGLYRVACQAVEPERGRRYPTLAAFFEAWRRAQAAFLAERP